MAWHQLCMSLAVKVRKTGPMCLLETCRCSADPSVHDKRQPHHTAVFGDRLSPCARSAAFRDNGALCLLVNSRAGAHRFASCGQVKAPGTLTVSAQSRRTIASHRCRDIARQSLHPKPRMAQASLEGLRPMRGLRPADRFRHLVLGSPCPLAEPFGACASRWAVPRRSASRAGITSRSLGGAAESRRHGRW